MAGSILLVLSVWSGLAGARDSRRSDLDAALQRQAHGSSLVLEGYFERARALTLMLSRNAVFDAFYRAPGSRMDKIRAGGPAIRESIEALDYVERLYPKRIGEICFIDSSGSENARVVRGVRARVSDLSHHEDQAPFFKPTFALSVGQVFQARPYVSPDTREWVISNSTLVPTRDGKKRAIVHFEVTVESFRRMLVQEGLVTRIVDGKSGDIVMDSSLPQLERSPLGRPADRRYAGMLNALEGTRFYDLQSDRVAVTRISRTRHNQNDWYVLVSAPAVAGFGLTDVGWPSVLLMFAALLTLGVAFLSFRSYQRELRRSSLTDALTGLPNRTLFHDRVHRAVLLARRAGSRGAVMILDLDRFKEVNDTLGHSHGDLLLREVGARLTSRVRDSDTIARLGGDEFAILMPEVDGEEGACVTVHRLRAALDQPFVLDGISVQVDTSFGIALFPDDGLDVDLLLQRADIAMYQAKRLRSTYAFYSQDDDPHTERRLAMVSALKTAIDGKHLFLHYQPKVELQTGKVRGVEALARWQHPQLGTISPDEFISIAEDTGLISALTQFVLDESLRQARTWLDAGLDLTMSVNLSARNLFDPHLVDEVAAALARHGVPAEKLELELTESSMMEEPERARMALEALRGMRISISVDDYGTGHSALAYLRDLPIDELKIDRSFVMNMSTNATDAFIVRSTIDLGRNLGLNVVAEGVEDAQTFRRLADLGCTLAQGFYLSRPVTAAEFEAWLLRVGGVVETTAA